ncbi:MAG: hypothetical protein J0L62_14530 [Bacteroidetes bacterium]|nr:hypothetical protein [Bacteroidota bacterium]
MNGINPWLIRSATALTVLILFWLVSDNLQQTLRDGSDLNRVVEETEKLESRLAGLPELKLKMQEKSAQKDTVTATPVRVPSDVLVKVSRIISSAGGSLKAVTTLETRQDSDIMELEFKVDVEASWSDWVKIRQELESLPFKMEFKSLFIRMEKAGGEKLLISEHIRATVVKS